MLMQSGKNVFHFSAVPLNNVFCCNLYSVQYHITRLGKDVTFAIFEDFCDKRPLLLFPVFEFEVCQLGFWIPAYRS